MIDHSTPLIATIVGGLSLAFLFGTLAQRLRLSPLVGYLIAGVAVGPFTPGFTANGALAGELAEIGVILLMFGVGLHFSLADLLAVKKIAVPGALAQIAVATLLGAGLAHLLHWPLGAGLIFGLALSVASTVVLLRALQERRIVDTERGHIAVGWLVVEDLAMVFTLVLLPALAPLLNGESSAGGLAWLLALTLGKVVAFAAVMLVVGRRVIPWGLHYIAHTGSRELFRLCVLVIALGVAFAAANLFGVSFALGAFFAGMILSESELSHRAAQETLPLRDAFAVLFFVSVGMLVDPSIILTAPGPLAATVAIIILGKSAAAFALVRLFGHGNATALTIAASLAQIGEFSFILAGLGVALDILPGQGRDLILAGALISIVINPFLFAAAEKRLRRLSETPARPATPPFETSQSTPTPAPSAVNEQHAVLVGYGRVGRVIGASLRARRIPFTVIEDSDTPRAALAELGVPMIAGNAADPRIVAAAGLTAAGYLFVAIPNGFEAGQLVEQARRINPELVIIARAHSDEEADYLARLGANHVIMGEREIALGMLGYAFDGQPS